MLSSAGCAIWSSAALGETIAAQRSICFGDSVEFQCHEDLDLSFSAFAWKQQKGAKEVGLQLDLSRFNAEGRLAIGSLCWTGLASSSGSDSLGLLNLQSLEPDQDVICCADLLLDARPTAISDAMLRFVSLVPLSPSLGEEAIHSNG